jgi:amidase
VVEKTEHAKGLRIAYVTDIAGLGVDSEVDAICRKAALQLRDSGATVDEIEFSAADGIEAYKTLRGEWMLGQQVERMAMLDKFGPNLAGNIRHGFGLTAHDIATAENKREAIWRRFADLFGRYDFLVTPAAPVPPYPVDKNYPEEINGKKLENYIDWVAQAFLVTMVGFPAGSVPGGKTASGLPVGLQIVGTRLSEPRILGLAKLIEAANPVGWPPVS